MTEPRVRIGGLMRCCIATLLELPECLDPVEGAEVSCKYCSAGRMIFRDSAWEWKR